MTPENHTLQAHQFDPRDTPPLWLAMPLTAMAGGMGWGIRGQYGHETGAMLAGVLVALVLLLFFAVRLTRLSAARAGAFFVLGISVGGSMTYGQTVGLTHEGDLIGNWEALRWGLLGLFIKGGIWISLAAALLGMGLSAVRYRTLDIALLILVLVHLLLLGVYLVNLPYNPAEGELPSIYFSFSDYWPWQAGKDLEPRRELWGGLLVALVGLAVYTRIIKRDCLAFRLLLWGFLAGGLGFSLGQCIQAYHAWNTELFENGWLASVAGNANWWNMMETMFGAIMGGVLALAVWLNRHLIAMKSEADVVELTPATEWLLVAMHVALVGMWNFGAFSLLDGYADLAMTVVIVPLIAVAAGRFWPYLVVLPITAFPIAGKTYRELCLGTEPQIPESAGTVYYIALPLIVTTVVAIYFARRGRQDQPSRGFCRTALVLAAWLYYGLNTAFFEFPFPWNKWTGRTPNDVIFLTCAICLTLAALLYGRRGQRRTQTPTPTPTSTPQAESA